MVSYTSRNLDQQTISNSKVIGEAIIMILGIIIFFCAVFVPIMFDNFFLMFPFFFGGFIIIVMGVVTLMIRIKNPTIATGVAPRYQIMRRYMTWANRLLVIKIRLI